MEMAPGRRRSFVRRPEAEQPKRDVRTRASGQVELAHEEMKEAAGAGERRGILSKANCVKPALAQLLPVPCVMFERTAHANEQTDGKASRRTDGRTVGHGRTWS